MTLEEQNKLAEKLKEVGYAKCVDTSYRYTAVVFSLGDIGHITGTMRRDKLIAYNKHCIALLFDNPHYKNLHPVEYFEVPSEKEILMAQLQ